MIDDGKEAEQAARANVGAAPRHGSSLNVRLKMKMVIVVLTLLGAVGVIAGATGSTNFYAVIPRHEALSRCIVVAFGVVALVAAFGCWKKKMFGWYFGAALIWMAIAWGVFRAVYLALTIGLPWLGLVLGGLGEAIKIGIFAWVLLRFWKKLQRQFKEPNQMPEPTSGLAPGRGSS